MGGWSGGRRGRAEDDVYDQSEPGRIFYFQANAAAALPACEVWGSFCGLQTWEASQYDKWKVAKSVKLPLLTRWIRA